MGFTLFAFGEAPGRVPARADSFDAHGVIAAEARSGFDAQELAGSHKRIEQHRFSTEGAMLMARDELGQMAPETTLIATEDFPQCEQPEIANGVSLFVPVKRRSDLDRPAFHRRWHSHGPLIIELVPGLLGYVQHHMTPSSYTLDKSGYDGVARFWFEDIEAVTQMPLVQPAQFERIVADENAFLAMPIENYIGSR